MQLFWLFKLDFKVNSGTVGGTETVMVLTLGILRPFYTFEKVLASYPDHIWDTRNDARPLLATTSPRCFAICGELLGLILRALRRKGAARSEFSHLLRQVLPYPWRNRYRIKMDYQERAGLSAIVELLLRSRKLT